MENGTHHDGPSHKLINLQRDNSGVDTQRGNKEALQKSESEKQTEAELTM